MLPSFYSELYTLTLLFMKSRGAGPTQPASIPTADAPGQPALNAEVLESLPLVSAGLGLLFAVFAVAHAFVLRTPAALPMMLVASATALILLTLSRALQARTPSPHWAHPIGTVIVGLILLNSLLHLYLVSEPQQTTNLMLLLIGTGCFFLSTPWLALVIGATCTGWVLVMWTAMPSPGWRHFGFALFTSAVLSLLIHAVRVRALRRLQRLRIQDERRRTELAAALTSSEQSRAALEASKRELEEMIRTVQESEERFRRFTDLEGIAVHANGKILDANPALARMFQYEPARILGMDVRELIAPESHLVVSENLRADFQSACEAVGVRRDGVRLPIELCGKAVPYHGRKLSMVMIRDITERKRAEDALRDADRRKDEFLAMLGHELRNPLAPIRNAAHVLRLIGSDDPTVQQAREMIERQVTHMTRLVDDLLDVSRISRGKIFLRRERLDLGPLIRAVIEDLHGTLDTTALRLTVELPDQPLPVLGDPTRLSQIVANVLHNACKFTDSGGRIAVQVQVAGAGTAVAIRVRDTGIGLEPAILAHIFEPFHQADHSLGRSRGGLGLGLALVKGLVEAHGGKVSVRSEGLNRGAEFVIELPLASDLTAAAPAPAANGVGAGSCRVLVIEDNLDAAESTKMLLSLAGYQVAVAHAGSAGVETARHFHPDVVLCDIGLPGGMDGYAVARALRRDPALASAYLIAVTGYGQEADQRRAREADFDLHVTKPFDFAQLQTVLEAVARGTAAAAGSVGR